MQERKLGRLECLSRPERGKKKKPKQGKQKALVNKYNKHPPYITALTKSRQWASGSSEVCRQKALEKFTAACCIIVEICECFSRLGTNKAKFLY